MTTELKAFHVGLFVSGLIIGVTTTWLSLAWRKVSPPVIVAPPQQQDAEKEPAKEEEEEEDEEYDSDEDLSESEENEAEANPHKLVRAFTDSAAIASDSPLNLQWLHI